MRLPDIGSKWKHTSGVIGTVTRADEDGIDLHLDHPTPVAPHGLVYGAFPPDWPQDWETA